jgi:hypothetical protein
VLLELWLNYIDLVEKSADVDTLVELYSEALNNTHIGHFHELWERYQALLNSKTDPVRGSPSLLLNVYAGCIREASGSYQTLRAAQSRS